MLIPKHNFLLFLLTKKRPREGTDYRNENDEGNYYGEQNTDCDKKHSYQNEQENSPQSKLFNSSRDFRIGKPGLLFYGTASGTVLVPNKHYNYESNEEES
jgi:hypothetical protein